MANDDEIAGMYARHNAIVDAAGDALQQGLQDAAADIVAEMKRHAPELKSATSERRPGELRDSIVATPGNDQVSITAGNDAVPYASYVEFGTSKMKAEPFFYPTIRAMAARTRRTIKSAISHSVSQAWEGKVGNE
jgi:HK97 gp10 family phage protein